MTLLDLEAELKNLYRERAHLVAHLTALFPHHATLADADPTTPGWPVATIETPAGQMSWHISPDDTDLFAHMPRTAAGIPWDGHSTQEKYERLQALTSLTAATAAAGNPVQAAGPEPTAGTAAPAPDGHPAADTPDTPRENREGPEDADSDPETSA